jgi:diacylglycerol O-acyltransferase
VTTPESPARPARGAPPAASEPLAAVDHAWLRMDEPANLMQINGVLVLAEPVDVERVREIVRERLLPIPRFRQKVVTAPGWMPRWEEDPDFDLDRHVLAAELASPCDDDALAAAVGELMSRPLDTGRPLWEFRLFQPFYPGGAAAGAGAHPAAADRAGARPLAAGPSSARPSATLGPGGCALVGRIHHAIGDGVALMLVVLSLTDLTPSGPAAVVPQPDQPEDDGAPLAEPAADELPAAAPPVTAPAAGAPRGNPFTALFCDPARDLDRIRALADEVMPDLMNLLTRPVEAMRRARLLTGIGSVGAFGRLVGRRADPPTPFKGPLGVPKLVAWSRPLPIAEVKQVGRALGGTLNDVLVATAAGALRRYLARRGELSGRLDIRAAMPVNLRPLGRMAELGNHFGLVFLRLPLGIADPLRRLAELRRRAWSLRRSTEPVVVYAILRAIGRVPLAVQRLVVRIFATKATLVMTNVPGPRRTLYLAGKPVRDFFFWVPQSGRVGLGISILSYDGNVRLGIGTDAGLVPDPGAIVEEFHAEFADLLRLARQGAEPAGPAHGLAAAAGR